MSVVSSAAIEEVHGTVEPLGEPARRDAEMYCAEGSSAQEVRSFPSLKWQDFYQEHHTAALLHVCAMVGPCMMPSHWI